MNRHNVGKQIKTHKQLQDAVKNRKWIIVTYSIGNPSSHNTYVAAAFINRRYIEVCNFLKDNRIFEYIKNKL